MALLLKVITPTETVINDLEILSVTVDTLAGTMTILENHAPVVSTITVGRLYYKTKKGTFNFSVERGLIKISANNVKILVESCVPEKK